MPILPRRARATTAFAAVCAFFPFLATDAAAQAVAQSGFALDRFEPSERGSHWFVLESLDLRGHGRPAIGVVADYAYKPLVAYAPDGDEASAIVRHQLFAHVGGSLILWDRLRLGLSLPVLAYQDAGSGSFANVATFQGSNAQSIGDLRLGADLRLAGVYGDVATLAVGAQVHLPTGSPDDFTGDGSVRVHPRLMVAGDAGQFTYALRAGFTYRAEDSDFAGEAFGSEMTWAAAAGVRLADRKLLIGPEAYGATTVEDPFAKTTAPTELILGGHYDVGKDWRFGAGVGPGLTRGFGTPVVRVVMSLEWAPGIEEPPPPPEEPSDRDGDGILDDEDACPDVKGVRSDDPEKHGCPLPDDRDGDGIIDDDDACVDEPGVENDDPKKHGCPLPKDRDKDGIIDDDDACVDEPGVENDDPKKHGCPPPKDTDGDGIIDDEDACVKQPGPANEDKAKHGCPAARIEKGQIRIIEQVQFATSSDRILPASDGILRAVLTILQDHPEVTRVSIEGHTDNRGAPAYNKRLSDKRAASVVRWLTDKGIEKARLRSAGFGMERPLDANDSDEGRQRNRRVEFHIREMNGKPVDANKVEE